MNVAERKNPAYSMVAKEHGQTDSKSFQFGMEYEDNLDLAKQLVDVFNGFEKSRGGTRIITNRYINLVAYFLLYGYSRETRNRYLEDFGDPPGKVRTYESILKNIGILEDYERSIKSRDLCPTLKNMRNYFFCRGSSKQMLVAVYFRKN
jgi:hypothetical protein